MKKIKTKSTSCLSLHVPFFSLLALPIFLAFFSFDLQAAGPGNINLIQDPAVALTTSSHQLTFVGPKAGEGYFSPDGELMIFQSERDLLNPFYQMYIANFKTGDVSRVSTGSGKTTCGWIHPSKKKVLFSSTHLDKKVKAKTEEEFELRRKAVKAKYSWSFDDQFDIFESDLKGNRQKRLTTELGYDAEGSYSPDGTEIVFASNRTGYSDDLSPEDQKIFSQDTSYEMDIYIMKADGSNVRRLTTAKGYDGGPFFSADGKHITWRRFAPNGATAEIFVMNKDGSNQRPVTQLGAMSWAPFFHPSDDYLVFTSSVLGFNNFELFIVDVAGKEKPVRVTNLDGFDGLPVFTPDGQYLTWTHRDEKGDSQIWKARWNDALARKLLKLPAKPMLNLAGLDPSVKIDDIQQWIEYLANPYFGGRPSGSKAEEEYTGVLANTFSSWGLKPVEKSFIQDFEFTSGVKVLREQILAIKGKGEKKLVQGIDFLPYSFTASQKVSASPVVFAGYGILAKATDKEAEYNSFKDTDLNGKWVVILDGVPSEIKGNTKGFLNYFARAQSKLTTIKNLGAVGVIVIQDRELKNLKMNFDGALAHSPIPAIRMSYSAADDWFKKLNLNLSKIQKELDQDRAAGSAQLLASSYLEADIQVEKEKSKGRNVVAFLKSTTGSKRNILIGAHGDHLGVGETNNSLASGLDVGKAHLGADDNASGVAGVMELAHQFSKMGRRDANYYFAIWSAEEVGILGSNAFATKSKIPFYAALNMDMIGRYKDRLYIQGVGSAEGWLPEIEKMAWINDLSVSTQADPYLPTDSMSFYLQKIPSISFFTGVHSEYHTPKDTAELINYPAQLQIVEWISQFSQNVAAAKKPLQYSKVESSRSSLEGRSFRIYLGTVPDYSQEGVKGVRISGVTDLSPAAKAGLQGQDIIVSLAETPVENLYDYVYILQTLKPNVEVPVEVMRKGQLVKQTILPQLKQ